MSENRQELWQTIRNFYNEKFGISPELVELAPVLDLLRLCASGSSNKSIAEFFGESEEGLMELFDAHLGFMGWKQDLSFSPLKHYKQLENKTIEEFKDSMVRYTPFDGHQTIDIVHMYESARLVERLERLFDETWI